MSAGKVKGVLAPGAKAAAALVASAALSAGAVAGERRLRRSRKAARRYRLRAQEPLAAELRRVARVELERACRGLERARRRDPHGRALHDARKSLKRVRAAVRLARPALGTAVYGQENGELRAAARQLSGMRDAKVVREALDQLEARHPGEVDRDELTRLRQRLEAGGGSKEPAADDGTIDAALAALRAAESRVEGWPLEGDVAGALVRGLRRIYRHGRSARRAVEAKPSDEALHELRKRAKDLRHAAELLRPTAPKRLAAVRAQARDLADLLGDDHDLALLYERADGCPALRGLVARRRGALQRVALPLAADLYSRSPRRFVKPVRRGIRKRTVWRQAPAAAI